MIHYEVHVPNCPSMLNVKDRWWISNIHIAKSFIIPWITIAGSMNIFSCELQDVKFLSKAPPSLPLFYTFTLIYGYSFIYIYLFIYIYVLQANPFPLRIYTSSMCRALTSVNILPTFVFCSMISVRNVSNWAIAVPNLGLFITNFIAMVYVYIWEKTMYKWHSSTATPLSVTFVQQVASPAMLFW